MPLKKTSTLCPFMRKQITFVLIAIRAGNDQIIRPIGSTTREWYHMIDMVAFAYFIVAIVTPAFLSIILSLYILGGVASFSIAMHGLTVTPVRSCFL